MFQSVSGRQPSASSELDEDLLTDRQLQEFLGVSRTTLWRLRKHSGLPFGRVGRSYRYRRSAVLDWVASNPQGVTQLVLSLEE